MNNLIENDISSELALLHHLVGADFSRLVERIAKRKEFRPIESDNHIFSVGGEQSEDYENLLNAARKAVSHGYNVYILPNPKNTRTPDFIFERKGTFRVYDLKTIVGKGSVDTRLTESIGQTNRILLNIRTDYKAGKLARAIIRYFERYSAGIEVMVFWGNKIISVTRQMVRDKNFVIAFSKKYYN